VSKPKETTAFPAAHEAEPAHVRANFIAAARRAVLAARGDRAAESDKPNEPGEDRDPGESTISNQTLIERIRQTFDTHRRPLLLSLALLILAAGTMQIVGTTRQDGIAAAPQPALAERTTAKEPVESAPPEVETTNIGKAPEAPETSTDTTGSLLEPKVFSVGTEKLESFSKRVADMSAVGELPSSLPPSLRDAALIGEPAAVFEVAARLAEGRDTVQNPQMAARLFEKAAEAGLAPAQYRLGNLYEKGFGVARDAALAKTWYERAAQGGNARAMHNLGVLLAEGVNGKPDYAAAQRWFLMAAEHGVKDSQFNLGVLLARGLGVGQDLAQSYKWFALAADQGDREAAKKRDEVGTRLPSAELAAAKAAVGNWKPSIGNPSANDVPPPPQGWTSLQPMPRPEPVPGRG
jgi:localization factor PodJL